MTMINREELIELFKKAQFSENYSQGQITVDSPSLVQYLKLAFEQTETTGWQRLSMSEIILNQTYKFYYNGTQSSTFGHVFKTVDQLCAHPYFRGKKNKKFFIINLKYDHRDSLKPQVIQVYENLLSFIETLKKAAIFVDSSNSKMLFLNGDKLEFEPIYSKLELDNLNIDLLSQITSFIQENTHESQKLAILSKAIISLCKNEPFDNRFKFFLTHLKGVYETLDHDFAVFSSNFSYEKLRSEIENAKLEEQVKIHKVITDIQNQILGIPVATVIVATQFKTQKSVENDYFYQFAVNTGITIGVCIFTLFMGYLIYNQIQSLTGVKKEIQRKDEHFERESPVVYKKIQVSTGKKPFQELFNRLRFQNFILWVIALVCLIALIATIIIYANITVNPYLN